MQLASRLRRWLPWVIGYVVLLAVVVVGMFKTRDWAVAHLSSPKSMADWQAWREDVRRQKTQPGPVQRVVPKSTQPPALVLMRDHFAVSLFGAILFSAALYWVFAWFVMGIMKERNDQ